MNRMTRRDALLGGAAAAALLTTSPAIAASKNDGPLSVPSPLRRNRTALVLSGGGARGAYEAGIIEELARNGGVRDGQPLAPFKIICGTSIGALNGWFVATGQYTKLRNLWATI
ncbi:MAG: patatin-like phospholipase family protein, partial [Vulcanimicrobiaceae bacterium]